MTRIMFRGPHFNDIPIAHSERQARQAGKAGRQGRQAVNGAAVLTDA
jgi:hypothetical protein